MVNVLTLCLQRNAGGAYAEMKPAWFTSFPRWGLFNDGCARRGRVCACAHVGFEPGLQTLFINE